MLARLQRGLEGLYRIDTAVRVDDFIIGADERARFGVARLPREQLLLFQEQDTLEVGLFVDQRCLANLEANDPAHRLDEGNIGDFLLAVEGVSHFVYVVWRARAGRTLSALELELQAEIDKYVICVLIASAGRRHSSVLRQRLFRAFELEGDLDGDERDRYLAANENASRYSASLERRFVSSRSIGDMLSELRRFYRMSLAGKLDFINSAA